MVTYKLNGEPFDIDAFQVIDDVQYPVGWFQDKTNRDAMGVTEEEVADPPPDLPALRAAKNEQINQWRAAANSSTFPYSGKEIACDSLSRSDIDGVANNIALSGGFPQDFPMAWKATDNTYIELADVDAFKAMYAAMTAQGTANFKHAQELKAQLASSTTAEEIAAIVW